MRDVDNCEDAWLATGVNVPANIVGVHESDPRAGAPNRATRKTA